ncbi:MAG: T9SS type A sorting domain-containing protein [Bacteroidales bacterium]|nr:T9SS type A sorting domain-containing protein [Bacteroidales bacterium]
MLCDVGRSPDSTTSVPIIGWIFEQKYYSTKNKPVYGVAVTSCHNDTYPPIVYLYQQDSTGVKHLVDSAVGAPNNFKDCSFGYEFFYYQNGHGPTPYSTPQVFVLPCMELYFETPHQVEDSIIIVYDPNNSRIAQTPQGRIYCLNDLYTPSLISYYYRSSPSEWVYYATSQIHGVLFPIVELRCRGGSPVPRVEEKGDGWARVSWSPDYVEEDYMVGVGRYGTEPADSLTFEVPRGDTSFTITGLENGYPYAVWVKRGCRYAPGGYDTGVWGDWGRYVSLYLPPDTTGILAADESGELKVYPNPAHGVLTVDLSEVSDDVAELTLSDLGGCEVLRTKAECPLTKVDVGKLPAGLYLLQAASPGKVYRRRVAVE